MEKIKSLILALFITLIGCSYSTPTSNNDENEELSNEINFTKFYVIGDRFSSGFMDGALYNEGQKFSYPNLVAKQIDSLLGEKYFYQPEVVSNVGYNPEASELRGQLSGKFSMEFLGPKDPYPSRVSTQGVSLTSVNRSIDNINNFSIPEMKVFEADDINLLQQKDYYNWIFDELITPVDAIIENDPGLVLVSLGMEDIFNFTYHSASGDSSKDKDTITEFDLISESDFESSIDGIISKLVSQTDSEILITTLFNPLYTPHFKTIGYELEPEFFNTQYLDYIETVYDEFNSQVIRYNLLENGGVPDSLKRFVIKTSFDPGFGGQETRNRIVIDENLIDVELNDGTIVPKYRGTYFDEVLPFHLLPDLNMESGLSGEVPLTDAQAILFHEIAIISNKVERFNLIINRIAESSNRIHTIEVGDLISSVNFNQFSYEGVFYSTNFDKYGIFSSDGYTFNKRGNALIANLIIEKLNTQYNTRINNFNPNLFEGIEFIFND